MSFRATFLKTVWLSQQVLSESGSDRNFGYFQSLPTVCSRPLSYTPTHTHTYNSASKMVAIKRHLLDHRPYVYGSSYCKTQFNNVLTCGAELIKSLRLFQLFTLSERKNQAVDEHDSPGKFIVLFI